MTETDKPDQEPEEEAGAIQTAKVKRPYDNLRRAITEDELSDAGARRLLLGDLDRLDREVNELKAFRDKFHESDKKCAVYDQQLSASSAIDLLFTISLASGSAILGVIASVSNPAAFYTLLIIGILLFLTAVLARAVQMGYFKRKTK